MKKILFIILTFSGGGGVEVILSNLINNLEDNKYDISILELSNRGKEYPKLNKNVNIISVPSTDKIIGNKVLNKIIRANPNIYARYIRKKYIKENYNIEVGCNFLEPIEVIGLSNAKTILWVHGGVDNTFVDRKQNLLHYIKDKIRNINNKRILKRIDIIIPISKHITQKLMNKYNVEEDKIKLMYNSYDFKKIAIKSISSDNLYDSSYFNIISVGRLDKNKNNVLMINSMKILKELGIKVRLNLIGTGDEEKKLHKIVEENDLNEYVIFWGFKDNPYPFIKQADLFMLTSYSEGFPTVLVESMSLDVPIISTNVSGVEEIGDNKYITIVEYNSYNISDKVIQIMNNYKYYKKLAEKGSRYVNKFSTQKLVNRFNNIVDNNL